jgi:AcrR family transcriptional regulator
MTRVRADDYDDKKQRILDKAAALIAGKGFGIATMMDVARACGSSKSSVYYYFPSKEDLLHAIIHSHITQQIDDLKRIVALPLSAEDRFAQFVDSFIRGAARSRNEHIMLMNDLKFLPKRQREQIRAMEVEIVQLLEELLSAINPEVMSGNRGHPPYSRLLFGMMIWTFTWYRQSGPLAPKELAALISGLFVDGFKMQPGVAAAP